MAFAICIAALAAFGAFSVFWCIFGWLLPKTGGVLLCMEDRDIHMLARRYLWLRDLGVISCPCIVLDTGLDGPERAWLEDHGIEICSREALPARLGIGEKKLDGTGNGDPTGRDQRRGLPEL